MRKISTILLILYTALLAYSVVVVVGGMEINPILTPLSTVFGFSFAVLHGAQRLGWKRNLLLLGITFGVSLLFESVGVATGWVYGSYHYTDKLGAKFLGLVPLLIPLAWFMMSYPSLVMALRLVRRDLSLWKWRIVVSAVGSLVMTAWDLAMDPMMVAGEHWIWDQPGAYFGIPVQNFWGWWLTIFVAFFLFFIFGRITQTDLARLPGSAPLTQDEAFERQVIFSYAVTGLTTIITDFQINLAGPALAGLLAMLPWVVLSWPTFKPQVGLQSKAGSVYDA